MNVAVLTAAALAVALSAAPAAEPPHPIPANDALAPILDDANAARGLTASVPPGALVVFRLRDLFVDRSITVVSIEPLERDPDVTVVGARVGFIECEGCPVPPGRESMGLPVISGCTAEVPPAGYGPTYDSPGITLRAGDPASFLMYVRSEAVGEHRVQGMRIRFRVAGEAGERVREFVSGGVTLEVYDPARELTDDLAGDWCRRPSAFWEPGGAPGTMPVR